MSLLNWIQKLSYYSSPLVRVKKCSIEVNLSNQYGSSVCNYTRSVILNNEACREKDHVNTVTKLLEEKPYYGYINNDCINKAMEIRRVGLVANKASRVEIDPTILLHFQWRVDETSIEYETIPFEERLNGK